MYSLLLLDSNQCVIRSLHFCGSTISVMNKESSNQEKSVDSTHISLSDVIKIASRVDNGILKQSE